MGLADEPGRRRRRVRAPLHARPRRSVDARRSLRRASASRLAPNASAPLGSQQTAASHAADACVVRVVVETGGVVWQHEVEVGDVDVRFVPVDQRDPIRGEAQVSGVLVTVNDALLSSGEPRSRCSASDNALRRHRAEVDLRPRFLMHEVGRRSPPWALAPAVCQTVQLAQCVGDATPVRVRLRRFALDVRHHNESVDEVPAVRSRDRHRHRHPLTVEVSQQLGLPREIGVAAPA